MLEAEVPVREEIHNLLLYGTSHPLQEPIIEAKNLDSVPPLFDAMPRTDGRPYAIFDSPTVEVPSPKSRETDQTVNGEIVSITEQQAAKPSISIILVPFSDQTNVLQNQRQVDRGFQRTIQYGRLIKLIDVSERRL